MDGCMIVAVDGACRHEGCLDAKAAYGIYFNAETGSNTAGLFYQAPITNQRADIYAAFKALDICRRTLHSHGPSALGRGWGMLPVIIQSDSAYLVKAATTLIGVWRRNDYRTSEGASVANEDLFRKLDETKTELERCGVHVRFRHVRRSRHRSKQAERMANSALDKVRTVRCPATLPQDV